MNRKREIVMLADEVEMFMDVDCDVGEELDTEITIDGSFFVAGETRKAFAKKMRALVDEYLI